MKRKIKRKVFLMGMALATGMPGFALAKGNSKAGYPGEDYRERYLSSSLNSPGYEAGGVTLDALEGRLNRLAGAMHDNGIIPALVKPPVLKLQMMPGAEAQPDDPRMAGEKRLGVALRIAF